MRADKTSCDHVVSTALSECLGEPLHTLFQVSTSAALVEGLYQGAVQVVRLLSHGDFGLGTFIDLDGEMVVLDGVYYQVSSGGKVSQVEGDRLIPYAVVTRFNAEFSEKHPELSNFAELVAVCDELPDSENMVWIDGTYDIEAVQEQPKYKRTSGVDFGPVDVVKYAEAFGAIALTVDAPDQIGPMLKKAFEIPDPMLIGVRVDYRDNHKLFEKVHEHLLN
jgi:Alpha-acetolactate decarboxylase/Thiamine pyrophosphate enzyme, C-terminal TPP binding domain